MSEDTHSPSRLVLSSAAMDQPNFAHISDLPCCSRAESQAETIVSWTHTCNGKTWLDEEKKRMVRKHVARRKTEGSFELGSDGVIHSRSYEKPQVMEKSSSFHLRTPRLPEPIVSPPLSHESSPNSSHSLKASSPGSSIMRKLRDMFKSKHHAARLDYESSSNLDGRSLCVDSSSVDMF
jgi:hypothetical protein